MDNKVWVLMYSWYDDWELISIHASHEGAKKAKAAYVKKMQKKGYLEQRKHKNYYIDEMVLEK